MKSKGATTGRVLMSYFTIRESSAALGLNIGGHAQTVRPLVAPMAEGPRKVNTVNFLKN